MGNCQSSTAATTLSLMLTVGMLGHLSRTPRATSKDGTVTDLVIPEIGERKKEKKRTIWYRQQKSGKNQTALYSGDTWRDKEWGGMGWLAGWVGWEVQDS